MMFTLVKIDSDFSTGSMAHSCFVLDDNIIVRAINNCNVYS